MVSETAEKESGKERHSYEDILGHSYPFSLKHPRMPLQDRAAQFSPFAALTTYEAAIREEERLTEEWIELTEEEKVFLDQKLFILAENRETEPEIGVVYFRKDEHKAGGSYICEKGCFRKTDPAGKKLYFTDGRYFLLQDIREIEGEIFRKYEDAEQGML